MQAQSKPIERLSERQRRDLKAARERFERAWHAFRREHRVDSADALRFEREYQALLEELGLEP